jgi:peptidoglycan/LPS O-acetylase OafA/YrhL
VIRNQLEVDSNELDYFGVLYAPSHQNIPSYFYGIIAGMCFYSIKEKNAKCFKVSRGVWEFSIIACVSIVILNSNFYLIDYPKPSILLALIGALMKHVWGIAMSTLIFGCATTDVTNLKLFSSIMNHKLFHIYGKISYSVFMCHLIVLKIFMAEISYQPIFLNWITLVSRSNEEICLWIEMNKSFSDLLLSVMFIISTFIGLLLTLMVDIPIQNLIRLMRY